jgi:hemolysin activation/secretion protein
VTFGAEPLRSRALDRKDEPADRKKLKEIKDEAEEPGAKVKKPKDDEAIDISQLDLPEDTTPRLAASRIAVSGNSLIPTDELLEDIPSIYNASGKPITEAESSYLYDLRIVRDILLNPGATRDVSTRSVQGFTQYLVSIYQKENYAGIFVRVKPDTVLGGGKLQDDTLAVEVIEMPVSSVKTNFYNVDREKKEESYLKPSVLKKWSPAKKGEVMNQKKVDEMINLLNLNPDRYVTATVTKGEEPQSLGLQYDVFEINPWHWFIQVDNSGTDDRQWNPRLGLINTNLTGRDDTFTAFTQFPVEKGIEDNYSIYSSYDFPLWTPKLRLNVFGARSEYEIEGGGGIDFLGKGYIYGAELRYNVCQKNDWFLDLTTGLTSEKSEVTTNFFPTIFASTVYIDIWSAGIDLHRRGDMANTSLVLKRLESIGGSNQDRFWNPVTMTGARTNAERDFKIITLSANRSQYLDRDKVNRLLGSFKYIRPDERLVPAKMTVFGGMYSVRGYKESRIVADGGILASLQFEHDLVRKNQVGQGGEQKSDKNKLKKLAPLVFFDYGRAKTKDHVPGEVGVEELASVGVGLVAEYGEHLNAGIYYGYPLRSAGATERGHGRVHIGVTARF